jgi:translation initiation factor IF-1
MDSRPGSLDNGAFWSRRARRRGGRGDWMAKDDLIELQGIVTEVLAGGNYKVKVGENHEVLARLNGKMRQYRIRVITGDRVTVGVSPYDLKRGLITYRAK